MIVIILNQERQFLESFASEMHYDNEFRKIHRIISENYVGLGEPIENEYHGMVHETAVLEVVVSN